MTTLSPKRFFVVAAALAVLAGVPATAAADPSSDGAAEPALVHATENNGCKLNVRAAAGTSAPILVTLSCVNYTTCGHAEPGAAPCAPYVVGEKYGCVGPDGTQVTDDRWAAVAWRAPEPAYVAVACAAFRR
ncbi:hypothetical protein SAMN05421810_103547 [Amycolatopsis arida]|uniref:Secreted protein n=1 Tax=Amycolatopsis arida TaxID=587909 RepID=A0A1I5TKE9_9PSEU|nr:hypothetical protein [Amycolatopsis arida]TDX96075.1 hypothetical protein CLV69_103210 [Amycolatopsis arida]SFP83107.1 hypothetical protein SAMN05421810_103547 [Amycolatopsis arida]